MISMDEGDMYDHSVAKGLWACIRMERKNSAVFAHAYDWFLQNINRVGLEGGISALRAFQEAGHYDRTLFQLILRYEGYLVGRLGLSFAAAAVAKAAIAAVAAVLDVVQVVGLPSSSCITLCWLILDGKKPASAFCALPLPAGHHRQHRTR